MSSTARRPAAPGGAAVPAAFRTLRLAILWSLPLGAFAGEGTPNILRGIFGVALLLLGPLVGGVALAFAQFGVYQLLVKAKLCQPDSVPIFPVLVMRGMLVLIAGIAVFVFWLKGSGNAIQIG